MAYSKKIVVFGATGSVGTDLIEIVSNNEPAWEIVAVSRSGPNTNTRLASLNLPNVDIVKGDVEDLESAKQITNDADMVFSCVGFVQYEQKYWVEHWPKVVDNLLAVTSIDCPLIFCDNLYAYGNPTTPITPSTRTLPAGMKTKPAIRSLLRVKLTRRMKEAPGSIVAVGGSDIFGPHIDDAKSHLGGTMVGKMVDGKRPTCLVSRKIHHDFCYSRDFANALYVVSKEENRPVSMGRFWICPHAIHNKTYDDIKDMINDNLDQRAPCGFQVVPSWLLYGVGAVDPVAFEMREMMHIWRSDYTVDAGEFESEFGVSATAAHLALKETVGAWKARGADSTQAAQ